MKRRPPSYRSSRRAIAMGQLFIFFLGIAGTVDLVRSGVVPLLQGSHEAAFLYVPSQLVGRLSAFYFRKPSLSAQYTRQEYGRLRCLHDIRTNITNTFKPLFDHIGNVALIFVAVHSNLGDNLLFLGGVHLIEACGHAPSLVCTHQWEAEHAPRFPVCPSDPAQLLDIVGNNALIFWHPGGNWGTLWRKEHQPRLEYLQKMDSVLAKRKQRAAVVQLPQSIFYNASEPEFVVRDNQILSKLYPGFLRLFARQLDSFHFAQTVSPGPGPVEVALSPDVAFLIPPSFPLAAPIVDVLILLRDDAERSSSVTDRPVELAEQILAPAGLSFKVVDWPKSPYAGNESQAAAPAQFAEIRWKLVNEVLSQGTIVITDRLHASIGSMLLGRRHIVLDNFYGKIKGVLDLAFSVSSHCSAENLHIRYANDVGEALLLAKGMLRQPFFYN